jgi:hypothetical protein
VGAAAAPGARRLANAALRTTNLTELLDSYEADARQSEVLEEVRASHCIEHWSAAPLFGISACENEIISIANGWPIG